MTLFLGSVYTVPTGNSSCAERAPLRICNSTGTDGGINPGEPFTSNRSVERLKAMLKLRDMSAGPSYGGCTPEPGERGWRLGSRRGKWRGTNGGGSVGDEVEVEMEALGA